ncbi:hypothetical protein DICPUDRAFT_158411 [Dictyostelium purpureum]|uniref:Protein kinase domain-containing protein n=1 Tax=Dictyostelium purpureum TaxID=5786 RepID=F1A1J9_DICPU|nr:uncharacterized protein DICPUDRAFT_158411 [Dictyostelium purpureum]EGC29938.1 hypothetical protein DICPUDRAFT_158411 [Dictyostelium purpureum]|eukprot:XP_003293541.1 hypothetical protein DICPUDRAFT_158411 [Dictyostelium purpureum]
MHSIPVAHADISNSNILVYHVGNSCHIKFMGFGIICNTIEDRLIYYSQKCCSVSQIYRPTFEEILNYFKVV